MPRKSYSKLVESNFTNEEINTAIEILMLLPDCSSKANQIQKLKQVLGNREPYSILRNKLDKSMYLLIPQDVVKMSKMLTSHEDYVEINGFLWVDMYKTTDRSTILKITGETP